MEILRCCFYKKAFPLFLSVVFISCVFGCSRQQPQDNQTLRIWHWMTDREEAFNELAKKYTQESGVPVRFELYAPSDLYTQKVRAAAQTKGLPDIFGVLGEMRDFASFINAGHVLPLTSYMDENNGAWKMSFFPIALAMNSFREGNPYGAPIGIYGVPIDVMSIQLFYNKRLLKELGFDPEKPPSTWSEWLSVGKKAREKGKLGLVSGWAELWLIDCFASSYAIHLMGLDNVEATFEGKLSYSDPKWVEVFSLFDELRKSGLLAEGIVTMVNKRAEQLFANEQAVFTFNGTWGINVYSGMNPGLDYGVMMLPPVKKNKKMVTWGGAGSSFVVNGNSPKAKQAVEFLKWLTAEPQQKYLLEATKNIPANRAAASSLSGPIKSFADSMDFVVHPRLFSIQEHSTVIEAFDKGIQSILIGEEAPEKVSKSIDELNSREHAKNHQTAR